ncbi:hypothetical protein PTQ46_09565 [Klebsiella michiganensis]|uniref:host cell division inhibitory peptide Kil n=1 Tax=Klebsiella michiganensis TaxID=1134687 RepID=UPI001CCF3ADD|nr:hypothetical protein [Klebsiella michiganensis]MDS7840460.1 hypothetical protein [Klebsiella michiganensis]
MAIVHWLLCWPAVAFSGQWWLLQFCMLRGYFMVSWLQSNPAFKAAQSKLAIAQFIGNSGMWAQAMASMRLIYETPWHIEGRGLYGFSIPYRDLKVEDIEFNNEMSGDLIYANADLHKAKYEVNTEVSF